MWAALRTHKYMDAMMAQTIYQTKHYQETVMRHVVENFMSLSRYDSLRDKSNYYDNRFNKLEQHCKIKPPSAKAIKDQEA